SALGAFFRRMRTRRGAPKAITAAAHKLARIIHHMLKTREPYDESVFAEAEIKHRQRSENRLRAMAQALGYTLAGCSSLMRPPLGLRVPWEQSSPPLQRPSVILKENRKFEKEKLLNGKCQYQTVSTEG